MVSVRCNLGHSGFSHWLSVEWFHSAGQQGFCLWEGRQKKKWVVVLCSLMFWCCIGWVWGGRGWHWGMVDTAGQVRHTGTACLLIIEMGTKILNLHLKM